MSVPEEPRKSGLLDELLHPEGRLLQRLGGVFRLDPETYTEIAGDAAATPQAFAVVIVTALVVGIGAGSLALALLGVAWSIGVWLTASALVWAAAALSLGPQIEFAPLLRCLGFAYAWFALFLGEGLPWIGPLFGWGAVLLCLASNVLATRQVLKISTELASGICALALGAPLLLLWLVF